MEVATILRESDKLRRQALKPVSVVMCTADCYASVSAKFNPHGPARAIFRERVQDFVILEESQAYKLDQGIACTCQAKTVILIGDVEQQIETQLPLWSRQPWTGREVDIADTADPDIVAEPFDLEGIPGAPRGCQTLAVECVRIKLPMPRECSSLTVAFKICCVCCCCRSRCSC